MKTRQSLYAQASPPAWVSVSRRITGLVFIVICIAASTILVLQHFGAVGLPGCGPDSPCAATATSVWGSVLGWPVSFLGLAYFTGLAAAWAFMTGCGVSVGLRTTVRLGAVVSVAYLLVMYLEQNLCIYCVVIHASNLVFWGIVERSQWATERVPAAIVTVFAGIALVSALLNVIVSERKRLETERAGKDLYRSVENAVTRSDSKKPVIRDKSAAAELLAMTLSQVDPKGNSEQTAARQPPTDDLSAGPTVRQPYRIGPEQAAMQLVVFHDYQSVHCRRIYRDVQSLQSKYGNSLSVTVRHFPMCTDCNFSLSWSPHSNACRAARAAETAGLLNGDSGFWKMHQWLFQQRGVFTDKKLKEGLVELGYDDIELFLETMNGQTVLAGILADVVEAQSVQIQAAPAVLLNDRRLGSLEMENAIAKSVQAAVEEATDSGTGPKSLSAPSRINLSISDTFSPQLQQTAVSSTVRVVAGQSVGSGVIIASRDPFVYVLTAYHIVPGVKRAEIQTYSSESYPDPSGTYSWATVIASSEPADLAVIRFSTRDPIPEPLKMTAPNLVPRRISFPVLTVGCDGQAGPPTCLDNQVVDVKQVRRAIGSTAVKVWEVADESAEGRSGGPLVNTRGLIIGIASGISQGKGYFCHADEIHHFLAENGLQGLLP